MIDAVDHILLAADLLGAAAQSYAAVLGHDPTTGGNDVSFQLANVRLALVTKQSSDAGGLAGLVFAVPDMAKAERLFQRRGLRMHRQNAAPGNGPGTCHIATDSTHGVPLSLIERHPRNTATPTAATGHAAVVAGLDHVVIRTPNPERAIALYAGRLGLSLRLDRTEPSWGARLLFFRCGDLIIEVAHDLKSGTSDERDQLWGLSWRAPDVTGTHARLRAAGVEVSDVRAGRRPGTRIFTVRSHTVGVPTVMIGPESASPRWP